MIQESGALSKMIVAYLLSPPIAPMKDTTVLMNVDIM